MLRLIEYVRDDRDRKIRNNKTGNEYLFVPNEKYKGRRVVDMDNKEDQDFFLALQYSGEKMFQIPLDLEAARDAAPLVNVFTENPQAVIPILVPMLEAAGLGGGGSGVEELKKEITALKSRMTKLENKVTELTAGN